MRQKSVQRPCTRHVSCVFLLPILAATCSELRFDRKVRSSPAARLKYTDNLRLSSYNLICVYHCLPCPYNRPSAYISLYAAAAMQHTAIMYNPLLSVKYFILSNAQQVLAIRRLAVFLSRIEQLLCCYKSLVKSDFLRRRYSNSLPALYYSDIV